MDQQVVAGLDPLEILCDRIGGGALESGNPAVAPILQDVAGDDAGLARAEGVREVAPDGPWPNVGLMVDAVLGTGATGAPRPAAAALLERMADLNLPIVAIDGPSGVDLGTGVSHGAHRATPPPLVATQ